MCELCHNSLVSREEYEALNGALSVAETALAANPKAYEKWRQKIADAREWLRAAPKRGAYLPSRHPYAKN